MTSSGARKSSRTSSGVAGGLDEGAVDEEGFVGFGAGGEGGQEGALGEEIDEDGGGLGGAGVDDALGEVGEAGVARGFFVEGSMWAKITGGDAVLFEIVDVGGELRGFEGGGEAEVEVGVGVDLGIKIVEGVPGNEEVVAFDEGGHFGGGFGEELRVAAIGGSWQGGVVGAGRREAAVGVVLGAALPAVDAVGVAGEEEGEVGAPDFGVGLGEGEDGGGGREVLPPPSLEF